MSRLLSIIILSAFLVGASAPQGRAQRPWKELDITKQEYRELCKKIRKMTMAEQIAIFDLGQKTDIAMANPDTIDQLGPYPWPSRQALAEAAMTYPDFLADRLGVHYLLDLKNLPEAGFYGLDSVGRILEATAYAVGTAPEQVLLAHDFILPVLDVLDAKALKKPLQQKLLKYLADDPGLPTISHQQDALQQAYKDWVIQVYAANKDLHKYRQAAMSLVEDSPALPDDNWLSHLLARQILKGGYNVEGERQKLVDGEARMFNFDTLLWQSVDSLMRLAIKQKAMPGGQLLVAKDGYVILEKAYGYQTYDSLLPINRHTLYDLASLTKVLATTQALMLLYDNGQFEPEKKLADYLPYLATTNKAEITGTEVLSHQANLYMYYPFWKKAQEAFDLELMQGSRRAGSKLAIEAWVSDSLVHWAAESALLSEKVDTITRKQYFYSDIGFFFLKDLIEKQAGQTLDTYLEEHLYKPEEIALLFNPLSFYADSLIAPTEFDRFLRNELVRGYVHDRNAALLGGVAGQAGLFGNARNIAELMQIHLDRGQHLGRQVFSPQVIEEFTQRHFDKNRRGLGWDMKGPEPDGPVSRYASDKTFGHTGFTGGMVWADPHEKLIFVFLSNRVYPSAENNKLVEMNIRTRIQDLIYQSLGYK